jgi:hypothetical protein
MKKLLLTGIAVLFLATGTAHAGDLASYRKPVCETAEDFAGCMANKKPQMWRAERIKRDCRHGFDLVGDNITIGEEEVEFILTITKTPTYKACKAYRECLSGKGTINGHCYENDKRWRGFHNGWW